MTLTAAEPAQTAPTVVNHRIVVGMDEDHASLAALRFAATEAAFRGCDVLALHVWQYPNSWGLPGIWPTEFMPNEAILTELQQRVDETLAERARSGEPLVSIIAEVRQGVAELEILTAAQGATLLVFGSRHHGWLVASASRAIVAHPPCPVVVVPAP